MRLFSQKDRKQRRAYSFKERFHYFFDRRMSRSSLGLIRVLLIASILMGILIAVLIILLHFNEDSESGSVVWNSLATLVNNEVPAFEDGGIGYVILMALAAIFGVLFTSVLIGIITSAIEERITELKKGKSKVLESNHIVILGFVPGEFTLLNQLCLASEDIPDSPNCFVIASDLEQSEVEESIDEGMTVPDNIRIIIRTADITDPNSLEKLSIGTCSSVIINPTDDMTTIKTILAVSTLIRNNKFRDIKVNAIISNSDYQFPPSIAEKNRITALQTFDTMARIIAHSCTQTGISELFVELFNYEGSELYLMSMPEAEGLTFYELSVRMDQGVPVGMTDGKEVILNPNPARTLGKGERLLLFAENKTCSVLTDCSFEPFSMKNAVTNEADEEQIGDTVIFGSNESLHILIQELPTNVKHITLVDVTDGSIGKRRAERAAAKRNLTLAYYKSDGDREEILSDIAQKAGHIVILNDHTKPVDEADMAVIFTLLNFRDLRNRFHYTYNITAELRSERNQKLVSGDDNTDFIVASNLSSLFLAQLAEAPELISIFRELLSNEGNEPYLKDPHKFGITGSPTVQELRKVMLERRMLFLGYYRCGTIHFNPPLDKEVDITDDTRLFVIAGR